VTRDNLKLEVVKEANKVSPYLKHIFKCYTRFSDAKDYLGRFEQWNVRVSFEGLCFRSLCGRVLLIMQQVKLYFAQVREARF